MQSLMKPIATIELMEAADKDVIKEIDMAYNENCILVV